MARGKAVVPIDVDELTPEALGQANLEERQLEAWVLTCKGYTQTQIAERLGCSRTTVQNYLRIHAERRLSRVELADEELDRVVGTLEAVVQQAWASHRNAVANGPNSLAGSNYLRLVLDTAREIARLKGLDLIAGERHGKDGDKGAGAEVVVRIGGANGSIEIGARTI